MLDLCRSRTYDLRITSLYALPPRFGNGAYLLPYLLTHSSSFLVLHRSSTRARHLTLFCEVPFASFHVRCFLSNSAILVRRQVSRGLPLVRFPCGLHSSALLTTCPSGLLNVWPIHPKLFVLSLALSVAALLVSKAPCC